MTAKRACFSALLCLTLLGSAGCPDDRMCIRVISCVATCGGPVLQSGCDPCPAGTIDDFMCAEDTGVRADTGLPVDTGSPDMDAPTQDAPGPVDAPAASDAPRASDAPATDAPVTASQVIGATCGPADGFALNLGLYTGPTMECSGDPRRRSVTFYLHDLGGAILPPTAGSTISSVPGRGSNGNATECPGGSPPCRLSEDFSVTFDAYTEDVGAAGSYTINWVDGFKQHGQLRCDLVRDASPLRVITAGVPA